MFSSTGKTNVKTFKNWSPIANPKFKQHLTASERSEISHVQLKTNKGKVKSLCLKKNKKCSNSRQNMKKSFKRKRINLTMHIQVSKKNLKNSNLNLNTTRTKIKNSWKATMASQCLVLRSKKPMINSSAFLMAVLPQLAGEEGSPLSPHLSFKHLWSRRLKHPRALMTV